MQGIFPTKPQDIVSGVMLSRLSDSLFGRRFAACNGGPAARTGAWRLSCLCLLLVMAVFPEAALATVSDIQGGSAGFDKAAADIYALATGGLGKTVATTAAGLGIVGLATGFNTRASAGALGAGLAVGLGPPVIVGVSGAAIF